MLEVTVYDTNGKIVFHEHLQADTASPQELTDMITLIDAGYPAHLAAQVAKSCHGCKPNEQCPRSGHCPFRN